MKYLIKELYKFRIFFILINKIYNFTLTSKLINPYIRGHKLKRLDKEIDFFIDKIKKGENFAFARNADGERAIMLGISVESQEKKWTSPNFVSKLGIDLLNSLNIKDKRFYYAISCPCCDREAYYWYSSRIENKNKTFANLWINANFRHFRAKFESIKKDAILIANYRAKGVKIGNINILKHYEIDDDCISFWEKHAPNMIDSIKKDFGKIDNLLYVVSAGPMSCVIIERLFLHNPNNIYVDFGSSIDSYYLDTKTRPYQDKYSLFGDRNCYMYEDFECDVSVVLTLYKRKEHLNAQIQSILNQSLKPKELILFIDSSVKKEVVDGQNDFVNNIDSNSLYSTLQSSIINVESTALLDSTQNAAPYIINLTDFQKESQNINLKQNDDKQEGEKQGLDQILDRELQQYFDNIIQVKFNVGVWGRFAGGLLAKSKYICFFDDDTFPSHRWLENCHNESLKKDGLYGGIGILSNNLAKYPFDFAHRTIGWNDNPPFALRNAKTLRVDFVGHSWFLKKDYLGAMWINSSKFYALGNVAEDAYLSFALKKYLNINTFVPPQDKDEFLSSTKGLEYGKEEEAISKQDSNLIKMNNALKAMKKDGMKEVSFSLKWWVLVLGRNIAKKIFSESKLDKLKARFGAKK